MSRTYLSEIQIFALDFPPRDWMLCNGQLLMIRQNQALFALLGTTYGGNGSTTFALPDLRSRIPKHFGPSPGAADYILGSSGGSENVALSANEMPLHAHTATTTAAQPCNSGAGDSDNPVGKFPAAHETATIYSTANNAMFGAPTVSTTINLAGGNQPHSNLPPYLVLSFCIAILGVFPSRN